MRARENVQRIPEHAEGDVADDRPSGESVEELRPSAFARRIHDRVKDHQSRRALGAVGEGEQSDRTTPVLAHEDEPTQAERLDEVADDAGVGAKLVERGIARLVREPKSHEVGHHQPEALTSKSRGHLPPDEAPRWDAVEQEDGSPSSACIQCTR